MHKKQLLKHGTMKTRRFFEIMLVCLFVLGTGIHIEAKTKDNKSKTKTSQEKKGALQEAKSNADLQTAKFRVVLSGSDCAALQHCDIMIVVYYSTGAEVGSATYIYGQSTYNFTLGIPPAGVQMCASLQVSNCDPGYNITPVPNCISGPFYPNTSYDIPLKYTCN